MPRWVRVALGAITEADRHNIRGERISVDNDSARRREELASAVRPWLVPPRVRLLVLAGSLMGGDISNAVEDPPEGPDRDLAQPGGQRPGCLGSRRVGSCSSWRHGRDGDCRYREVRYRAPAKTPMQKKTTEDTGGTRTECDCRPASPAAVIVTNRRKRNPHVSGIVCVYVASRRSLPAKRAGRTPRILVTLFLVCLSVLQFVSVPTVVKAFFTAARGRSRSQRQIRRAAVRGCAEALPTDPATARRDARSRA